MIIKQDITGCMCTKQRVMIIIQDMHIPPARMLIKQDITYYMPCMCTKQRVMSQIHYQLLLLHLFKTERGVH